MNSEELEVSLRTEFENHLKNVLAEMRQEISQLQEKVTSELERHQSQLNEVFAVAVSNFEKEPEFDAGFKESVIEHLRLSRDEGAQITAMAIAKAEELEKEKQSSVPSAGIKEIHQAVSEISSKTTQSEILRSLVEHAADFAPRGVFFIVKNEHLVGWRAFGKEKGTAEEKVRDVFVPVSANSLLSNAVKSLTTVNSSTGGFADDLEILEKIEFGQPEKMVSIPLVARGRGVAVLYADYGSEGGEINVDALETLVRVAGLTVEVLASAKSTVKKGAGKKAENVFVEESSLTESPRQIEAASPVVETVANFAAHPATDYSPIVDHSYENADFTAPAGSAESVSPAPEFSADDSEIADQEEQTVKTGFENSDRSEAEREDAYSQTETTEMVEPEPTVDYAASSYQTEFENTSEKTEPQVNYQSFESTGWAEHVETAPGFPAEEFAKNFAQETDPAEDAEDLPSQVEEPTPPATQEYEVEASNSYEVIEAEPAAQSAGEFIPTKEQTYGSFEPDNAKTESASQPLSTPPLTSRLSERNVDLPIEVTEDERRLHNDARRFARLLVSEIKLYNEQKVREGREANDLYERLKEAIDRSREMYDKRVQPLVAAKFDYFHYELVNALAEGDENRLGSGYLGSSI